MLRRRHLATALAMLIVLAMLLAAAFMAADWWRHSDWYIRLPLLLIYLTAVGSIAWLALIRPMSQRWSNRQVLSYLDATSPAGRDMLMDLYELCGARDQIQELASEQGRQLADEALASLTPLMKQVRPGQSFMGRATGRWLATAGVVLLAAVVFSAKFPDYAGAGLARLFNPFSDARWPHKTTITVYRADAATRRPMVSRSSGEKMQITPEGVSVPQMEKLPLAAHVTHVTGTPPGRATLFWKSAAGGEWVPKPLEVRDGWAYYEFAEVGEPIIFYIQGGDYVTARMPIHIIERPYVKRVLVDYDYPNYAGIPDRSGVEGGGLYGLQGTKVKLTFELSMPVDEAVFLLEEDLPTDALLTVTARALRDLLARQETLFSRTSRLAEETSTDAQPGSAAKLGQSQGDLARRLVEQVKGMREAAGKQTTFRGDAEVLARAADAAGDLIGDMTKAAKALARGQAGQAKTLQKSAVAAVKGMLAALSKRSRMQPVGNSDTTYAMSVQLRHSGRYSIHLSKDGYTQARKEAHHIRVIEDRPPKVQIVRPMRDLVETRLANIEVAFNASDDYGLRKVEFIYKTETDRLDKEPAKEKVLGDRITGPIDPERTGNATRRVPGQFKWQLRRMDDLPDSGTLTYYVRVLDIYPSPDRPPVTTP
ncbi:hypothetical protein LCGC14_1780080, partial [marine sediment metagenome]